ncbi:hypothetical protein [Mesorhizobium sp. M0047]|uniref:hypothetical protein n=1 Tax=Mesorhizobium sp. M0047 TaxID=2956859 RepID=UPI00333C07A8
MQALPGSTNVDRVDVLYDELIMTLEGNSRLRVGDEVFNCGAGDVLWVPEKCTAAL